MLTLARFKLATRKQGIEKVVQGVGFIDHPSYKRKAGGMETLVYSEAWLVSRGICRALTD